MSLAKLDPNAPVPARKRYAWEAEETLVERRRKRLRYRVQRFISSIRIWIILLVLVIAAPEPPGAEKPLNAFETLTLAPIDRRLILTRMLTGKERTWVDSYHARVHEVIGPLVDAETRAWLEAATRPL